MRTRWPSWTTSGTMFCRRKQCEKYEEARAGALAVLRRMFWGVSRSATSPERVGCGPRRDHSGRIVLDVHRSPELRRGRARVFTSREAWLLGRRMEPVRAAFGQKRSLTPTRGSNPGKLTLVLFLVPTRFLFHARFRFERRNPRLERRCLDPFVTGVPP